MYHDEGREPCGPAWRSSVGAEYGPDTNQ
jgi:hypothetical protein